MKSFDEALSKKFKSLGKTVKDEFKGHYQDVVGGIKEPKTEYKLLLKPITDPNFITVCAYCKKTNKAKEYAELLRKYPDAKFSDGICDGHYNDQLAILDTL